MIKNLLNFQSTMFEIRDILLHDEIIRKLLYFDTKDAYTKTEVPSVEDLLTDEEAKHVGNLFHVISDLERIGDHAENLLGYANRIIENNLTISEDAKKQLDILVKNVYIIYQEACEHLYHPEQIRYDQIYQLEDRIDNIVEDMKADNIRRLNESICKSQEGLIFVETLVDLERISDHCLNIAPSPLLSPLGRAPIF